MVQICVVVHVLFTVCLLFYPPPSAPSLVSLFSVFYDEIRPSSSEYQSLRSCRGLPTSRPTYFPHFLRSISVFPSWTVHLFTYSSGGYLGVRSSRGRVPKTLSYCKHRGLAPLQEGWGWNFLVASESVQQLRRGFLYGSRPGKGSVSFI